MPELNEETRKVIEIYEAILSVYLITAKRDFKNLTPYIDRAYEISKKYKPLSKMLMEKKTGSLTLNMASSPQRPELLKMLNELLDGFIDVSIIEFDSLSAQKDAEVVVRQVMTKYGEIPHELGITETIMSGALIKRIHFGILPIDDSLKGGIVQGSQLLFTMQACAERDAIVRAFLFAGMESKDNFIVVLSDRTPEAFKDDAKGAGIKIDECAKGGRIKFIDWFTHKKERVVSVLETGPVIRIPKEASRLLTTLKRAIAMMGQSGRIVMDASEIIVTMGPDRCLDIIEPLTRMLHTSGYTLLATIDPGIHDSNVVSKVSNVFGGVMKGAKREGAVEIAIQSLYGKRDVGRSVFKVDGASFRSISHEEAAKVEREVAPIEQLSPEEEARIREEFKEIAELWRIGGYNIKRLKVAEDASGQIIQESLKRFEEDVLRIRALKERYNSLEAEAAGLDEDEIAKMFLDVDRIPEIEKLVRDLEAQDMAVAELRPSDKKPVDRKKESMPSGGLACPDCGSPLDGTSFICSRCGLGFGPPEGSFKCPGCDNEIQESDELCRKCGRKFDRSELYDSLLDRVALHEVERELMPEEVDIEKEQITCPVCGNFVDYDLQKCPLCGATIVAPETESVEVGEEDIEIPEELDKSVAGMATEAEGQAIEIKGMEVTELANGRRNGKVNGKINGRKNGRINGRINGKKKGKINGRINGMINGRINGKKKGKRAGRINGKALARVGRLNGRINGKINGRINGKLVKPKKKVGVITKRKGFALARFLKPESRINGKKVKAGKIRRRAVKGKRVPKRVRRRSILLMFRRTGRTRNMAVAAGVIAILIVVAGFIILIQPGGPKSKISVDGSLGDWANTIKYTDTPDSAQDNAIVRYGSLVEETKVSFFVQVSGIAMGSTAGVAHSVDILIDQDNSELTGYKVDGIGADIKASITGDSGSVKSASAFTYFKMDDQLNYTSWVQQGSVSAKAKADTLEVQLARRDISQNFRAIMVSQDSNGNTDVSDGTLCNSGRSLVVKQEDMSNGLIPTGLSKVMKVTLSAPGEAVTAHLTLPNGFLASQTNIPVTAGQSVTIEISYDTSVGGSSTPLAFDLTDNDITTTPTGAVVRITGTGARAYISSPPSEVRIDGIFSDWRWSEKKNSSENSNIPDSIDIVATGFTNRTSGSASAFFLKVKGNALEGALIPSMPAISTGGGGGIVVPRRVTGEDNSTIYVDSKAGGNCSDRIGADLRLTIKGREGMVTSAQLDECQNAVWVKAQDAVSAAASSGSLEASIPRTLASNSKLYFVTTNWQGKRDSASQLRFFKNSETPLTDVNPIINEVMFGGATDWVEIYGGDSGEPINLMGWNLTNEVWNGFRYILPSMSLTSGCYLVVYLTTGSPQDLDCTDHKAVLYAGTSNLNDKDVLSLYDSSTTQVIKDFVAWGEAPGTKATNATNANPKGWPSTSAYVSDTSTGDIARYPNGQDTNTLSDWVAGPSGGSHGDPNPAPELSDVAIPLACTVIVALIVGRRKRRNR